MASRRGKSLAGDETGVLLSASDSDSGCEEGIDGLQISDGGSDNSDAW